MNLIQFYLQSQTHKVLSVDLRSNMLNHCYLISSKDEFYLHELSIFAVKEICCLTENAPCNVCNNCIKIDHGNMVDFEVFPKEKKSLMVEDINLVVEKSYVRPMEFKYKIFLLENFDECTIQGQNKILKTLEEPPQNVIFILTCKNIGKILPTILSRSKKTTENILSHSLIIDFLKEMKIKDADIIASMSEGSLTNALKLIENDGASKILELSYEMLINLKTSKDILYYSSKILELKKDIPFFLDMLINVLRDTIVSKSSINLIFKSCSQQYETLKKIYSSNMIEKIIKKVCEVYNKIDFNCNITGTIDQLLLDILEVKYLCQK